MCVMSVSVDLTNLRSMTDGDKDLEVILFHEFCSSAEVALQKMAENSGDGHNESWRSIAHALKGTSYNLGANGMGNLCKAAQNNPAASATEKRELLERLQAEYAQVKQFLKTVHA